MPARSGDDNEGLAGKALFQKRLDVLCKLSFDLAALAVDGIELACELLSTSHVVREHEIESHGGIPHAARCVEARYQREAQLGGRDVLRARTADGGELCDASARVGVDAANAIGDESAVLTRQVHEICDGAQRGEVSQVAPDIGLAEARAQNAQQLECYADACEVA